MRIRRFEAKDSSTALAMIKEEMGEDAVILATKHIPGRKGEKPTVEVVAAIDYDIDELTIPPVKQGEGETFGKGSPDTYDFRSIRRRPMEASVSQTPTALPRAGEEQRFSKKRPMTEVQSEAHDLRLRFANILRPPRDESRITPAGRPPLKKKTLPAKPAPPNPEDVAAWRDQLVSKIRFSEVGKALATGGEGIIALVGATGVGKTTTAAKLAAWYSLRQGLNVCLLSMDCYRIGATDQLRTYARIMRVPCEVVLRKADLHKALQRHADKIIIIDTAGKSPYDEQHIQELQEWFAPFPEIVSHLVLNATTKKEDIQHVVEVYRPLNVASLILTKLDETRAYAALCHQVVASALPISYLGTGQRVPEDFQIATKAFLDTLFKQGWDALSEAMGGSAAC